MLPVEGDVARSVARTVYYTEGASGSRNRFIRSKRDQALGDTWHGETCFAYREREGRMRTRQNPYARRPIGPAWNAEKRNFRFLELYLGGPPCKEGSIPGVVAVRVGEQYISNLRLVNPYLL